MYGYMDERKILENKTSLKSFHLVAPDDDLPLGLVLYILLANLELGGLGSLFYCFCEYFKQPFPLPFLSFLLLSLPFGFDIVFPPFLWCPLLCSSLVVMSWSALVPLEHPKDEFTVEGF